MTGGITPAHVAVAIVAASRILKTDPERVFEDGRLHPRTRILAAAGCCARLGWGKSQAGKVFHIQPQRLAPSMLTKEGVTTEQLLDIADALEGAGLTAGVAAGERFRSPWEPETAGRSRRTQVAAAGSQAPRKPGQERPSPSRPGASQAPSQAPEKLASGPRSSALRDLPTRRDQGCGGLKRQASGRTGAAARARARPSSAGLRAIADLKPVSDNIARWSGYFLEARWRLATVADLFDVCPVALLDALDPVEARA